MKPPLRFGLAIRDATAFLKVGAEGILPKFGLFLSNIASRLHRRFFAIDDSSMFLVKAPFFPDLVKIDEEIQTIRAMLESPQLSERHRKCFTVLLNDYVKKRRNLVRGIKRGYESLGASVRRAILEINRECW